MTPEAVSIGISGTPYRTKGSETFRAVRESPGVSTLPTGLRWSITRLVMVLSVSDGDGPTDVVLRAHSDDHGNKV